MVFLHVFFSKKRVMIEYVLLSGVNDAPEHAHELGKLLQGKDLVMGST